MRTLVVIFGIVTLFFISCHSSPSLFRKIESAKSGITFNNEIIENDTINIIDQENVYNGGGVGSGDFNNDGLQDLYFTGNLVASKLYLNKGNFKFEDITQTAGVEGKGRWARGAAVVDINNDGWLDIYVCATLKDKAEDRANLLYVNKGINDKGIPVFEEMAAAYGIADTGHSTMAAFFDYDNDGDLDLFIATNEIVENDYPNRFRPIISDGTHPNTDRLYRNEGSDSLGHPYYKNVSKEAGILWEGYAHAVAIADLNLDGWKDIYVSNDYLAGNILYINNRDGTFTNRVAEYFKHGSANAMGNDIIDVNNDGLSDLIELDMNPEDNYRKKMMMNPNSYQTYQNIDYFNYHYQYVRNTLQINQGRGPAKNDSTPNTLFAELAWFAGVAETDWSWTPSVADFDMDGFRDIIITNGFPRDVTDHDFIAYRNEAYMIASKTQLLEQIPAVKIRNYAFRNQGNLSFENVTDDWGFETPSFTNGAIYVDLDNDGDPDYVTNNINDAAFVYENTTNRDEKISKNYLRIKLNGTTENKQGLGTWVDIFYNSGSNQSLEYSPYRGYLSSVDPVIHFGLDSVKVIDSVVVKWPGGKKQTLKNVDVNQLLPVSAGNANERYVWDPIPVNRETIFSDITETSGITYKHEEKDFIDFNIQKLLPHKMSQYGPALASGDINGDELDDIIIGASKYQSPRLLIQQKTGKFSEKKLMPGNDELQKSTEDMGLLLFDADNDSDLDLYVASGSYENLPYSPDHRDNFWINDGKGNFKSDTTVLPVNYTSKSCVKAADYDNDGDLDLFIGGRVYPGSYPKPVSSFIYRNDSEAGRIRFTDVTASVATGLKDIGLVCDALWTDFDNDGMTDLVLAGEWMPVTFLKNDNGVFKNITSGSGVANEVGWWNSIAGGDVDNDGDIDYVLGNLGLNSFYKASEKYPVAIYAKDFDNNGSYDAFPALFIPDKANGIRKEFPAQTRDDLIKQVIGFRQKFPSYQPFAIATADQLFTEEEKKGMITLKATQFRSAIFLNEGNGRFTFKALPVEAQWSPVNGMIIDDFNNDDNLDLLLNTNDYGTEVTVGRYDALNGLLLLGRGNGAFDVQKVQQSGIFIPGDGKAMISLSGADGSCLVAASQNKGKMILYKHHLPLKQISVFKTDKNYILTLGNGKQRREEIYHGSSFLSQSSGSVFVPQQTTKVEVTDYKSAKRTFILN